MDKLQKYRRLTDLPEHFPVKKKTLYSWKYMGRYPEIFAKIGNALCIDVVMFEEILESSKKVKLKQKKAGQK